MGASLLARIGALALLAASPAVAADPPLRIGLLETADPMDRAVAAGAVAEVDAINRAGGVGGSAVEVVRMQAPRPWLDGAGPMASLTFGSGVTALIGPADGAAAHLAAQIATRGRLPLLTPSAERSLTRAFVPWIFRAVPDDREQARALLRWLAPAVRNPVIAIVVPEGREGRERAAALRGACADLDLPMPAELPPAAGTDVRPAPEATVVLLWLDAAAALEFLRALPADRPPPAILASLRLDDPEFLGRVPARIGTLALPRLRAGRDAGTPAAPVGVDLGHDMVRAIAAAASGGIAAATIRDRLADGDAIPGRTGTFVFDDRGDRRGEIPVGTVVAGRLLPAAGRAPDTLIRGEAADEFSTLNPDEARHGP